MVISAKIAELLRFGAVALAGLAVDVGVSWGLARLVGLQLTLAAAIGFLFGAIVNYLLHEFWTFQDGSRAVSLVRIGRYAAGLSVVLLSRLLAVAGLEHVLGRDGKALAILLAATALSFVVNYMISRHFVFTPAGRNTSGPDLS